MTWVGEVIIVTAKDIGDVDGPVFFGEMDVVFRVLEELQDAAEVGKSRVAGWGGGEGECGSTRGCGDALRGRGVGGASGAEGWEWVDG